MSRGSVLHNASSWITFFQFKHHIACDKNVVKLQKRWGSLCCVAQCKLLKHFLPSQASHSLSQKHGKTAETVRVSILSCTTRALEAHSSKSSFTLHVAKTWLNCRNGECRGFVLHNSSSWSTCFQVKHRIARHKNVVKLQKKVMVTLTSCAKQALEARSSKSSFT